MYLKLDQYYHPWIFREVYTSTTWITLQFLNNIYKYSISFNQNVLNVSWKWSVMKFQMIEIETPFTISFYFVQRLKCFQIKRKNMTKAQVKKIYHELISKPNVDIWPTMCLTKYWYWRLNPCRSSYIGLKCVYGGMVFKLKDAKNAFNEINQVGMLWTVRHLSNFRSRYRISV